MAKLKLEKMRGIGATGGYYRFTMTVSKCSLAFTVDKFDVMHQRGQHHVESGEAWHILGARFWRKTPKASSIPAPPGLRRAREPAPSV